MLGERRSKAAFSAGFPEAVREETRQDSGHLPEEIMETEASLESPSIRPTSRASR